MTIKFPLPFRRVPSPRTLAIEPAPQSQGSAPRIARLVALAHKLDALVRSGEVPGYGELARLGHISPARLTQIMTLLHLAPSIQECLLFLSAADARFVNEAELRRIAREPRWDLQRRRFERCLRQGTAHWASSGEHLAMPERNSATIAELPRLSARPE